MAARPAGSRRKPEWLTGSFLSSAALHISLLMAMIIGMPHMPSPPLEMTKPIPIDIMDIGEMTTTKVVGMGNVAAPTDIAPPPPAENNTPPEPTPPPPKPPEPAPPKPEPPKPDEPTIAPKDAPKPPPKKPETKPVEKPADDTPKFDNLLKDLTKPKNDAKPAPDAQKDAPKNGQSTGAMGTIADKLTISEEDALRRQIEQCWNIPAGARDIDQMVVDLRLEMNEDRTIRNAAVIDTGRMNADPFYRALAESALRAIKNPKCNPLMLPIDRYDQWRVMTLRFNPKDMLGT